MGVLRIKDPVNGTWVDITGNGAGVPGGGLTDQVLTKVSDADNDTAWKTPAGGGGPAPDTSPIPKGLVLKHEVAAHTTQDNTMAELVFSVMADLEPGRIYEIQGSISSLGDVATPTAVNVLVYVNGTPVLQEYWSGGGTSSQWGAWSGIRVMSSVELGVVSAGSVSVDFMFMQPVAGNVASLPRVSIIDVGQDPGFIPPTFEVTALDPTSFGVDAPYSYVNIYGNAFEATSEVMVDGVPWAGTIYAHSPTNMAFDVLAGDLTEGEHQVGVRNGGSDLSNTLPLTVGPPAPPAPMITGMNPCVKMPVHGNVNAIPITIYGANFTPESTVTMDADPELATYVSETEMLTQFQPNLWTGDSAYRYYVSTPDGISSNFALFTVYSGMASVPPTIAMLSPTEMWSDTPEFELTITGSGFESGDTVQLSNPEVGQIPLTPYDVTDTEMKVLVPTIPWGSYMNLEVRIDMGGSMSYPANLSLKNVFLRDQEGTS
jgi:hypothetical protein